MPSIVGTFSFPHIEAFFFKKIIFSATESLDENFCEKVIKLDLNKPESLLKNYQWLLNNKDQSDKLIENNRRFYDDHLSKRINIDIYSDIIDNYFSDIKK